MMSAPDKVDIDLPNTEDAKMVSAKSTENLRHLLSPSQQMEHQQRSQQRKAVLQQVPGAMPSRPPDDGNRHRAAVQSAQRRGPGVDATGGGWDRESESSPPRSHTAPPIANAPCHRHPHHHKQPMPQRRTVDDAIPPLEYTAWTIGSTEALLRSAMAVVRGGDPAVPPAATMATPYNSAILARCGPGMAWRGPSPDVASSEGGGSPVPMSAASSVSGASPTPPPLHAHGQGMPPTPGGICQDTGGMGGECVDDRERQRSNSLPPQYSSMTTTPSAISEPVTPAASTTAAQGQAKRAAGTAPQYDESLQRLYHTRLLSAPASSVESLLSSSCESLNFDIAEMWLRTGPKTHQLTNSHVRPTALDESVRKQLVDVYYGERSAERTHRLSPALCKRAKEAGDVVWVTAHTVHGAEALKCSISDVRTAVAVPVCHCGSGVNVTIIYFSIRR
jgi:hypothetical protein